MKMRLAWMVLAVVSVVGLLVARPLDAGGKKVEEKKAPTWEMPQPGPEHKELAAMVGTWDAKVTLFVPEKMEMTGKVKRTMILDGRYLKEDFKGNAGGMKFQGLGLLGYDTQRKEFVATWMDSMGTGIQVARGKHEAGSKSCTMYGDDMMNGKKVKVRDVVTYVSPNEQLVEMYRTMEGSDKEFKMMEITFTRAAEAPKKEKKKKDND